MDRLNGITYLWTPLIGFDKTLPEYGAEEYLNRLGFTPEAISLFVFNADIVNLHQGMDREIMLPLDMSNYHGSIRNEIRDIQQWSNYELRGLCDALARRGVKPLLGLMGIDNGEPKPLNLGAFSPHCHNRQRFLMQHPELYTSNADGSVANLNVLKCFRNGDKYEDFFAEKLTQTIRDYHMAGVHLGDAIMPQAPSAWCVDFSDDMLRQFLSHSELRLPDEITRETGIYDFPALKRRSAYIWNRHRMAWLQFMAWRWEQFVRTICDALHKEGQEVTANGFWCTEPFEAYYRYGVDYKALCRAGLDYLLLEDQASSVYVADMLLNVPYNMQKYNLMPMLVRAFAPSIGLLGFSAVKDSTEEWCMITHMPSALEREIYSLPNTFLKTGDGLARSLDGFLVCLADGLTKNEWIWLKERYNLAFGEVPQAVLTPLMVFSDSHVYDFMPEYIKTRRWSHFKQLYEFGQRGGQIAGCVRVSDLGSVEGAIFVPNIDVLPARELAAIAAYGNGPIIATTLAECGAGLPDREPEYVYDDPHAPLPMRVMCYNLGLIDTERVGELLRQPDDSPDLEGLPMYAPEAEYFTQEMPYRKVSDGFASVCALVLRAAYRSPVDSTLDEQVVPFLMADGRYRLLLGNNLKLNYRRPALRSRRRIARIRPYTKFPALPPKLIVDDAQLLVPADDGAYEANNVTGFLHKIPPFGASIVDVWLHD